MYAIGFCINYYILTRFYLTFVPSSLQNFTLTISEWIFLNLIYANACTHSCLMLCAMAAFLFAKQFQNICNGYVPEIEIAANYLETVSEITA